MGLADPAENDYPEKMKDRLFHDPELVQFYDAENGWGDDTRYCLRLAEGAHSVLAGHAFQCFLTDADQRAVCKTIAPHLAPEGRFIFDSRNPAREEWREWVPERSRRVFDLEHHGRITAWNDVARMPLSTW